MHMKIENVYLKHQIVQWRCDSMHMFQRFIEYRERESTAHVHVTKCAVNVIVCTIIALWILKWISRLWLKLYQRVIALYFIMQPTTDHFRFNVLNFKMVVKYYRHGLAFGIDMCSVFITYTKIAFIDLYWQLTIGWQTTNTWWLYWSV